MFTECVTAPMRTSATLRIGRASGVPIARADPYAAVAGADVIAGRGASSPDPSALKRYGGVKTCAFLAR